MDAIERLNRKLALGALALAILAALAVHAYLAGATRRALLPQTVPVVIAATDIPAHTAITAAMVTVAQYAPGNRPVQALESAKDAVGGITTVGVYRGQAVVSPDLSRAAAPASLSYAVTPGMRAYTLSVNVTSGVGDMIQPADHVDVLGVFALNGNATVDTVLQNVRVLAVAQRTVGQGTAVPKSYGDVTLEVWPADAARLAYAGSRGLLQLTLRGVTDAALPAVPPDTGAGLIGAH